MGIEIERRFVVFEPPGVDAGSGTVIEQGYLAFGDEGTEVRVRRAGDRCSLTVKRGRGLTREETEITLSPEQFDALWPETVGRRLVKRRVEVPCVGGTIELDAYEGGLAGLVVAEIEFPTVEASRAFTPPAWCACEVTEDPRFRNRSVVSLTPELLRKLLTEIDPTRG